MKQNKEPQRFPVDPETTLVAYEILIKNCRNHHDTCLGCPLHIIDPAPYQPSGIPHYTCAAFSNNNIPPADWPELESADGGQVVAVEQDSGIRKGIDNFCKEAEA